MSPFPYILKTGATSPLGQGFQKPAMRRRSGFALIVTVTVMVLVTMLILGLVAVSTSAIRVSRSQKAKAEAEQNARLAVSLALGRLQLLTGQDTRVTANSDLFTENGVKFTGAWRSWEGTDRESNGKPIPPDYEVKMRAGSAAVPVDSGNGGRFLGWLASSATPETGTPGNLPDASATPKAGYVPMVGESSVAAADQQVHMKPTLLSNNRGGMAWWISGDNTKAMINADKTDKPTTLPGWQERVRSNGRMDAKVYNLEAVDALPPGSRVPTTDSLGLVASSSAATRRLHDLTAYNIGLMTNTANGGWRKDFSLMSERYTALPATRLPFLTISPGVNSSAAKASPSSHPAGAIIYPWGNYRSNPGDSGWAQVPPICSWDALVSYTQQYRAVSSTSASRTSMPTFVASHYGANERFNFQDQVRRAPQIARIHWIYSLCTVKATPADGAANAGKFKAGLLLTPVLTLWNPYNIELTVSSFSVNIQETAPLRYRFRVGETVLPETTLSEITRAGTGYQRFHIKVTSQIRLAPGASRIFSLIDKTPKTDGKADNVVLVPGYTPGGGYLFFGINKGNDVFALPADRFGIEKISYDAPTMEGTSGGKSGFGIIYDINIDGGAKSAHRMIYDVNELGGQTVLDGLYPPLTRKVETKMSDVELLKNRPFASAIFAYRMASPPSRDPRHRHLFSKGMLQANPLCYYTEIGFGDDASALTSMAGTGVYHPINAPYDFAFQDVDGWNDSLSIPQWESRTQSSYIVSGLAASDGLTRCVMAELPTRPLQSMADLVHFDARNNNPIPPFQFNLIGNGSANPIFGPTQLGVSTTYNNGMCNDDTYLLNNLLFDDWFFSSIAMDVRDFTNRQERAINKVYEEHLTGTTPLPNRFYRPARGADLPDAAKAASAAVAATRDQRSGKYPFEWIASKLEVEGMFNINSVSLDAWKALLRQARNLEVPYLDSNGVTKTGAGGNNAFSYARTSIAGDQGTDSKSSLSGGDFPSAVEFAGHRALTDDQIDALAVEIVKQIRARGPFLSLSEFVNRQLSSNKDLAIAGTIQRALDVLAERGNDPTNPYHVLQENSVRISSLPPGQTDYKFPEAAYGWSAFGVPGWIRQADILRPIAPMISARDDTFTLRAYGDARDSSSRILARSWCEVVVRRTPEYVDTTDTAAVQPHSAEMQSTVNKIFGRRYEIVSFRWLAPDEI